MASQETTEGGLAPSRYLKQVSEFLNYLRLRFVADSCARAAASLSYSSLLALVPLLTVVFVTVSAFPAFHSWQESIEGFLFENFVPGVGEQVRVYLLQFTDKARGLQAAGVAVLLLICDFAAFINRSKCTQVPENTADCRVSLGGYDNCLRDIF